MFTLTRCLALLLLGLVVAPLISGVGVWYHGEGGTVNLPAAAARALGQNKGSGSVSTYYRFGYRMQSAKDGIRLVLPRELAPSIATFSYDGVVFPSSVVDREVRIAGAELTQMQQTGVERIALQLRGYRHDCLILIVLQRKGKPICEILVE